MSEGHVLRISSAELHKVAAFGDAVANLLIERHLTLAGSMAELFESGWNGPGSDACRAAWQEWDDGFRRVIVGLNDETTALQMAADAYQGTDGGEAGNITGAGQQL